MISATWREESARLVGALIRMTRDLDLAEDLALDALVSALESWPSQGIPDNPGAWLMTTATRRAVDSFRRADNLRRKTEELGHGLSEEDGMPDLTTQVDFPFSMASPRARSPGRTSCPVSAPTCSHGPVDMPTRPRRFARQRR